LTGGEALVVLDAVRRGELEPLSGLPFIAADARSATNAIGILIQRRRESDAEAGVDPRR
jgi:hypothetical protein